MRHSFTHTRTFSCTAAIFDLSYIRFDAMTHKVSKRDVFLRVLGRTPVWTKGQFYMTKTLDEALAITDELAETDVARIAAGVIAYKLDADMPGAMGSLTLDNQTGCDPDMTGVAVHNGGSGTADADWDFLCGHSSAPGRDVLAEIKHILTLYMGSGQALDGFNSARIIKGPEEMRIASRHASIVAAMAEEEDAEAPAGYYAKVVNFSVIVGKRGVTKNKEDAYDELLSYAGAVSSILGDENNLLNGVTEECRIGSIEGPRQVEGDEEPYEVATVNGLARFPLMHSDR